MSILIKGTDFNENGLPEVTLTSSDGTEQTFSILSFMTVEINPNMCEAIRVMIEALEDIAENCGPPTEIASDALRVVKGAGFYGHTEKLKHL